MRTQTKPASQHFNIYLDAHQRAYAWAERALAYRYAGKLNQAMAAAAKADRWLQRIAVLERQTFAASRHAARSG